MSVTFVCAHVALRTALSCLLPDGDVPYYTINKILGIDHKTRRVGDGTGLPGGSAISGGAGP